MNPPNETGPQRVRPPSNEMRNRRT